MTSSTIEQLYKDRNVDDIIKKITSYRNEFDIIKSELYYILCENKEVEHISSYREQIYHIVKILLNLRKDTSPYWKEFKNSGQPKSKRKVDTPIVDHLLTNNTETYNEDKYILTDKINHILNTELPWYESHLFRLYYIPFPDPHCEKQTYSFRDIERMHTYNYNDSSFKLTHIAIFLRVKKTFDYLINRLVEEKLLTDIDIKRINSQRHKVNKTRGPSQNFNKRKDDRI